jgi:neural Wiskott-Aldrich syndrome protein
LAHTLHPDTQLTRGALASLLLHALVLAALIVVIPTAPPPEAPEETGVSMEFGPATPSTKGTTPADVPKPPAPTESEEPPAVTPPQPQPLSVAPPPPPPPPPPAPSPSSDATVPLPPAPPQLVTPEPTPTPTPPPPKAPPTPNQAKTPPLPLPPTPVPPPPVPSTTVSPNSQPNQTKNPAPDSQALDNTLEKLRALVQKDAPKARYNPAQGGSPHGGGNPNGSDTASLSADQRAAIGDEVRQCWTRDAGALNADQLQVRLQVTTDANGVARVVTFAPEELPRMNGDPVFRAFAERARRAVLDARCAALPLPRTLLGQSRQLDFRFSP